MARGDGTRRLDPILLHPASAAGGPALAGLKVLSGVDRQGRRILALEPAGRSGVRGSQSYCTPGSDFNPLIGVICTVVPIVRNFAVRRLFEAFADVEGLSHTLAHGKTSSAHTANARPIRSRHAARSPA